jgi:hypothetical protein
VLVPILEVAGRALGILADVRDFFLRPGGVPGFTGPDGLADERLAHVGADPAAAERRDDGPLSGQHQAHRGFPLLTGEEIQVPTRVGYVLYDLVDLIDDDADSRIILGGLERGMPGPFEGRCPLGDQQAQGGQR